MMPGFRKKILFLEVNSSYSHTMLSYGYLRAFTEKMSRDWEWKHICATTNDDPEKILTDLSHLHPDVICGTLYLFNHEYSVDLFKKHKKENPRVWILLGGPEFLGNNEKFLRQNPDINAVIRGDESSFPSFLSRLDEPERWNEVPGLCFIAGKKYYDGGFANFAGDLDEIPSPYDKGYFTAGRPFYQLETSRGCSGKCTFCTSSLSDGSRYFSLNRIRNDLKKMHQLGIREIRMVDRTFNEDRKRGLALLKMFREYPDTRFHLEINPALVDEDLICELRKFNDKRLHIEAGIQSLCVKSLKSVKRFGSAGKMISGLRKLCAIQNAEVHTDLIAGLPSQKFRDVLKDVKKLIPLNPHEIQLENLKILPGTPISDSPPRALVSNPRPPYEVLKTSLMTRNDLKRSAYLSKLLDSFLNVPRLQNLFRFAFRRDEQFIEKFLAYVEKNSDPMKKEHLDKRLLLIKSYAEMNDPFLAELTVFFWLACGYPPGKFGFKPEKIKHIQPADSPTGKLIYVSDAKVIPSRTMECQFSFNAGELWNYPYASISRKKHAYQFFTAHGNRILKILEIG